MKIRNFRILLHQLFTVSILVVLISFGKISTVQAATFTVTKTTDTNDGVCDSDCSLREAIIAANSEIGIDTINIPSGIYTLTIAGQGENASASGDLDINDDLTLSGAGKDITIINGNSIDRVFHIISGNIQISEISITGGRTADAERGGGIYNGGSLTLVNSSINNNTAYASDCFSSFGGGINNIGTLSLVDSFVTANTATWGGGIINSGTMTITNSIISENTSSNGGGIRNNSTVTISNSTISNNSSTIICSNGSIFVGNLGGGIFNAGYVLLIDSSISANTNIGGGSIYNYPASSQLILYGTTINGNSHSGIANQSATIHINNSTISGNGTEGIRNILNGQATVASSTITDNHGGYGGLFNETGSTMFVKNSIVAGNYGGISPDLNGAFITNGFNLIGKSDGSTGFVNGVNGDKVGTSLTPLDPKLGILQDNGGSTITHTLIYGSPAVDSGNPSGCTDYNDEPLPSDQRGFLRLVGSSCDIGSIESDIFALFLPLIWK